MGRVGKRKEVGAALRGALLGGGGGTCGADTYGEMALVGLELWGGQLWGWHCRDGTMGMVLWGWN